MKVVVFGATGNVGSAVMRRLEHDDTVSEIVGVARRLPREANQRRSDESRARWRIADIGVSDLGFVEGADAVIDLAWMIQPSRDEAQMRQTNVIGTRRIVDAVVSSGVPKLIYASSVGAYAAAPKSPRVDESWPTTGIRTSTYSRHKAEVESMLDAVERAHPDLDIVRMRTSLVFQRSASSEIHRLFLGRLLPWHLPRPFRLIPRVPELQFQATHADDVAEAYRLAVTMHVRGPSTSPQSRC